VSDVFDPEVAADAARGIGSAGPLGFRVGARTFTYHVEAGSVRVDAGLVAEGTIVAISEAAWSDLIGQDRTFVNLYLAGELEFEQGDFSDLLDWDPVLKFLHAGIPIFDPGRADLGEVDLSRTFTLDDTDAEMRAFLITAGFLHVRGVFGRDEIATLNCEVDRLAAEARPGDDRSWWATDSDGQERLCRLVYVGLYSLMVGELEGDPRLARLGRLLDPELRMAPDRMEGTAALIKVPGPTTGLSNIPWHQDCGMGGHSTCCPAAGVGIQLTGSSAETGNLLVVPGSHGQSLNYDWEKRWPSAPVVAVDTEPGDVTVHIQDLMHASPKPTGTGGRRTLYVTFFPPTLWDHIGPGEAFNDLVRNRTAETSALGSARKPH
jgi:hypothetical protein